MIAGGSVVSIVAAVIDFYALLILVYVLSSWFQGSAFVAEIRGVLATICEPFIGVFRRIVPMAAVGGAGLDFSPLVALLALQYLIRPLLITILSALL